MGVGRKFEEGEGSGGDEGYIYHECIVLNENLPLEKKNEELLLLL